MGLFDKFAPKGMDWQKCMTQEDIDQLEKDGCDVTGLRAQQPQTEETQKRQKADMSASIHLEKLDAYKSVPRSADSQFFKDVAGKPPLFGKDKWRSKFENAELVYAAVVQANSDLWSPGTEYLPAVIVYTSDSTLRYDTKWLTEMAEKISGLKNSREIPADCKEFIKTFKDDQSIFKFKVGTSITGNVDVWCETLNFEQSDLPNNCLPPNGILPFLLYINGEDVMGPFEIPAKYYI